MPDKLALREALDELWGLLEWEQIEQLEPETKALCVENHVHLWHDNNQPMLRKIREYVKENNNGTQEP